MWSIALFVLSIISSALWYRTRYTNKYKLNILALISGGATLMFFVDAIYTYLEEGTFIELSLDALTLSLTLVIFTIALWIIAAIPWKTRR
ncbi:MAG: hypothetical protein QXK88_02940 [Desulfurococcaceae archaeon]